MDAKNLAVIGVVVVVIIAVVILTVRPSAPQQPPQTSSAPTQTGTPPSTQTQTAVGQTAATSTMPPATSTVQSGIVTSITTTTITTTVPSTATSTSAQVPSGQITGTGSTFIYLQMLQWAKTVYNQTVGKVQVTYTGTGSGAGMNNFVRKQVDFGAGDIPMSPDLYKQIKGQFVQFPAIIGSAVFAYNVPEIAYSKTHMYLNLTAEVVALIAMGNITYWDDPRIKALNPGLANLLPHQPIIFVHRAEPSGTNAAVTLFLAKAYPPWNSTVGWGLKVNWPIDALGRGIGAQGNPGVAQAILQNPYSIGYVEFAYWYVNKEQFNKIGGVAYVQNPNDGKWYFPSVESVQLGASSGLQRYLQKYGAYPKPTDDWNPVSYEFDDPPQGYPIIAFTYIYLWQDYSAQGYPDAAARAAVIKYFFTWILTQGQSQQYIIPGYIPLPKDLAQIGLQAVNSVRP